MKLTGEQRERLVRSLERAAREWALIECGYDLAIKRDVDERRVESRCSLFPFSPDAVEALKFVIEVRG